MTREELNNDALARFESLLDDYLHSGKGALVGIHTVRHFVDTICLSSNYFGDLLKSQTGKTAQEFIQLKMITHAKNALLDPGISTKQVAENLGFQYPQHFIRFFKKQTGQTPKEYRSGMS